MKGLLVKDYYLLFQRKQTILLFLAVCLLMGFSTDGSFVVGYMSFLSVLLAMSTVSYDDADNGMIFLMTLPVSRRSYALSKYVLGALFGLGAWFFAIGMALAVSILKGQPLDLAETLSGAWIFLLMTVLMLDLMIPVQLKYGAEKSRIVMILVFGGITACGVLLGRIPAVAQMLTGLIGKMDAVADIWYSLAAVLTCVVLTLVSVMASIRVMEKKTF